eukprot:CCRYP_009306-RC/>CCRYP_009306-RC protein AED:0.21 eAED:0.21 QI:204/0.85/0.75/1/0.85/0.75/8/0/868
MPRLVVSLCLTTFLLVTQSPGASDALAFPCRQRRHSRHTYPNSERRRSSVAIASRPVVQSRLHAALPQRSNRDANNSNSYNGKNEAASSILNVNGAYSHSPNAWGYSRTVVNDRERRRYERQRIRHRMKFGKAATTQFDDQEMDEDGYWGMFGRSSKRGFVMRVFQGILQLPRGMFRGKSVEPGTLILVRHGESLWNANKTFTGWADPDLSPQGYREVEHAARLLLEGGYKVDVVFTSRLKRAIRSSWILLKEMNESYLPVFKSWRLNERMYGALTGLSKTETAVQMGAELVQEWRGSLRSRPPPLTIADKYYPGRDRRHSDLSVDQIPLTESLLDCMERTKPLWVEKISYELACGRNVLVVAHANTLRGLVKIIDSIGDDEIQDIAIPTGIPIVYKFDKDLNPIPPSGDQSTVTQVHMSGIFLEKPGLLKQAIKREQEWCANVPDYDKVMSRASSGMTPLERSLSKLEASRQVQQWANNFVDDTEEEDDGTDGKLTLVEQDKVWEKGLHELEEGEYFDPDHPKFEEARSTGKMNSSSDDTVEATLYNANSYNPCVSAMPAAASLPGLGPVPVKKSEALIVMIRHGKTENNKLGLFTGWDDVPLAAEGVEEAKEAGRLLKLHGFEFDVVYTSWLSRAIETAWYVMDEMDCIWLPIIKSWRLNERMYGDLTGLSKAMVKQQYGEKQFKAWRRGYAVKPPHVSSFSPQYPGNDMRYRKYLKDDAVPKSESLKDCMDRTIPYFTEHIMPEAVSKGKRVLIASSENAIRGLLMHLCEIPEEKISGLEIPNGLPLIFDLNSKCVKLLDDGTGRDPLEVYNFGASASYLFRPCMNPDGSYDEECSINFMSDGAEITLEDNEVLSSIRRPVTLNV